MLASRGRIALDRSISTWVMQALAHERAEPLALTPEVAVTAGLLAEFPGDPADRIIYSTARLTDSPLVTRDAAMRRLDPQRTLW